MPLNKIIKTSELEGYGCWWSKDYIAKEHFGHVASHFSFPIAMAILIFWDDYFDNPKMAIALSIPAFVSLAYHAYLTKGERLHFVCNCFMIADYAAITTGVVVGLVWNIPIVAPSDAFIVSVILAFVYVFLSDYVFCSRTMHAIWHFISLIPLLVYVAVDLKPSQSKEGQGEQIEAAAQAVLAIITFFTALATAWTWHHGKEQKSYNPVSREQSTSDTDTSIAFNKLLF